MRDLEGDNARKYEHFISVATSVAKNAGFSLIQTPILEETKLFKRSVGESSDIVNKEMYNFTDKGENDVCLRPENTAGVVRSYVERKLDKQQNVARYFYYGPMFRYERPQKGRFRQFYQFGCESFAKGSVYEDVSIIVIIADIFKQLNIDFTLEINSLGCKECRAKYNLLLGEKLHNLKDQYCTDCHTRMEKNPLRVLDCKVSSCQEINKNIPKINEHLCKGCKSDFDTLKHLLEIQKIAFSVNANLVRGLDYYNKTAFEFVSTQVGSQNAIAGGGRYDDLVGQLGGSDTAGVGFAIGIDRILELITPPSEREGTYLGFLCEEAKDLCLSLGFAKRKNEKIFLEYDCKKLKQHLKNADKANARYCAIIGEDELKNNQIWIKDLSEKQEQHENINIWKGAN